MESFYELDQSEKYIRSRLQIVFEWNEKFMRIDHNEKNFIIYNKMLQKQLITTTNSWKINTRTSGMLLCLFEIEITTAY